MSTPNSLAPVPPPGTRDIQSAFHSFEEFLGSSADVIEALGAFVGNTGKFEKTIGVSTQEMARRFMQADIDKMLQAMGPSVAPLFVKVSLRLGALGGTDVDKMSSEEKISFGASMRELSVDMRRMLDAIRESVNQSLSK